jgi:transposase InsO family protein
MDSPILAYPDFTKTFVLDTDASDVGTGAVLSQDCDGTERVNAYYSKMLRPEEMNYCTTRKELLAIIKAVKHFRNYLYGRKFIIRTDHAPLTWLLRSTVNHGQVGRWLNFMSEYDYEIKYRGGLKHGNADGLSRQTCAECKQCERHFKSPPEDQPISSTNVVCRTIQTLSQLANLQQADSDIKPVYKAVQRNNQITEDELKQYNRTTKKLAELIDHMSILPDGTLAVHLPVGGRRKQLTICPAELRKELVAEKHTQAHLGYNKTLSRLMMNWYWPGIAADVRRHVSACTTCQQSKSTKIKTSGQKQHLYVGRPWQLCAVDLVGPLEETTRKNSWIIVITDHFTRWSDAIPIPNASADTVATILDERIFSYFGVPEVIHTDQGSQFESDLFKSCCTLWNCKKTRTAPYTPTANSLVERGNRVLGSSLRALLLEHQHQEWDLLVPQIMRTIRATPHSITGETANFMMLGREVRLPESLTCPEVLEEEQTVIEYVENLQKRMKLACKKLRGQQDQRMRMDGSEEPPVYMVGDLVWLKSFYKQKGKSKKLMPKYIGPYTILETLPHHTYRMERNGKISIQHEGRIKLCQGHPNSTTTDSSPTDQTRANNSDEGRVDAESNTNGRIAELLQSRGCLDNNTTGINKGAPSTNWTTRTVSNHPRPSGCMADANSAPNLDGNGDTDVNQGIATDIQVEVKTEPMEQNGNTNHARDGDPERRTSTRTVRKPRYLDDYYLDA